MKKILVLLLSIAVLSVFAACGDDTSSQTSSVSPTATIKENLDIDSYVDRYIELEKAENNGKEPEVTVTEGPKSNATKLTYEDNVTIELYSKPEVKSISGANLRVATAGDDATDKKEVFYKYVKKMMKATDPTLTEEQIADTIEIFRNSEPKEGGTGMSTRSENVNNVTYAVFYYSNEGLFELIIT